MRCALWLAPLLTLGLFLGDYAAHRLEAHALPSGSQAPVLLNLVQSWCYYVEQGTCEGSWSQPQSDQVIFTGPPGVCDVAFAIPRAVRLETEQGPTDHLTSFTSDPSASTALVYASRNLMVLDNVCSIEILLLP